MADTYTPVSAFAVHASKRKSLDNLSSKNKLKIKRLSLGNSPRYEEPLKSPKTKPFTEKKSPKLVNGDKKLLTPKASPPEKKPLLKPPEKSTGFVVTRNGKKSTQNLLGDKLKQRKNTETKSKIPTPESIVKGAKEKLSLQKSGEKSPKKIKKLKKKSIKVLQEETDSDLESSLDEVHSKDDGKNLFEWLISPCTADNFFKAEWEKAPMFIQRKAPNYYKHVMSTPLIDDILRDNMILFTKNIDVTSYANGIRETHNPPGRALPSVVWDYYMNGCSVRLLNPQTYIPKLHTLNATLQEYFGCFVGANSYLTPPNSQGFAPHYDDIEAFILQIEGKKRWRLYKPRRARNRVHTLITFAVQKDSHRNESSKEESCSSCYIQQLTSLQLCCEINRRARNRVHVTSEKEFLPRFSSRNFDQSEIGEPILDVVLNAGDLLYFPRGTIHQGETIDDTHSLHVTLSVYQKNSWGDYLEKLVPHALQEAIANDIEFRDGLPMGYLEDVGCIRSDIETERRKKFAKRAKYLLNKMVDRYLDIDDAADKMAASHIHDFLPPVLTKSEIQCTVYGDGERMIKKGEVVNRVEIEPDTKVKLTRGLCARLVQEVDGYRLYYSCENSKEYHEYEPQFLEIDAELVPAIREIVLRYPDYVRTEDLPIDAEDTKIQLVKDLWEKGILITKHPLTVVE